MKSMRQLNSTQSIAMTMKILSRALTKMIWKKIRQIQMMNRRTLSLDAMQLCCLFVSYNLAAELEHLFVAWGNISLLSFPVCIPLTPVEKQKTQHAHNTLHAKMQCTTNMFNHDRQIAHLTGPYEETSLSKLSSLPDLISVQPLQQPTALHLVERQRHIYYHYDIIMMKKNGNVQKQPYLK